jgi:hypothetical protein
MDIYSQHHLKIAATEPEHLVRKAEFDAAINGIVSLAIPQHRQRIAVGGLIAAEPNGRAAVQLLDAMGIPAGKLVRNVILLPVQNIQTPEYSDLISRARKDNPLNDVEVE